MTKHPAKPHPRQHPVPRHVYRRRRAALILAISAVVMLFFATHSLAATSIGHGPVLAAATLPQVITNLRNWIVGILAGLATLFLTIGGLRYVMAGGDPAEVEKAKGALKSAAFGYVLAVLAPALVSRPAAHRRRGLNAPNRSHPRKHILPELSRSLR